MDEDSLDFGELSHDENFKQRLLGFKKEVESASSMMDTFLTRYNYDELSPEDKVRIRGIDPNEHEIKGQISRVREYMNRSKKIYEKKTIMPRVDQDAAKRFVRSGLWTPQNQKTSEEGTAGPDVEIPRKRIKTEDDTEDK